MEKGSGLLLHISALESPYGIGSLGAQAYKFIDFLKDNKMNYWQMLPVSPTQFGDSPYQSFSRDVLNPYFLDLDILHSQNLLTKDELDSAKHFGDKIEYSWLFETRLPLLHKAYERFNKDDKEFVVFKESCDKTIKDYSLYMMFKELNNYRPWNEWEDKYKYRDYIEISKYAIEHYSEYEFFVYLQFELERQWASIKDYANSNGVLLIGDIAIYVAYDSAEVWLYPQLFQLDKNNVPEVVAGVPPDCFTDLGQLWGNPIYDWKFMKNDDYSWWRNRVELYSKKFDYIRIDHFRGFESYYSIKFGKKDARIGKWHRGPCWDMLKYLKNYNIIAEDLGNITSRFRSFMNKTGFPGMKILEFAFDGNPNNEHKPSNTVENCVSYIGTHDNEPLVGYIDEIKLKDIEQLKNKSKSSKKIKKNTKILAKDNIEVVKTNLDKYIDDVNEQRKYLGLDTVDTTDSCQLAEAVKEIMFKSRANVVILQIADLLNKGDDCRINMPGILTMDNWSYKLKMKELNEEITKKIAGYISLRTQ